MELGGLKLYEFDRVGVSYKPQNTIQYLYIICASGSKFTFYIKLKQGLDVSKSAFTAKKEGNGLLLANLFLDNTCSACTRKE